eukprot:COSAG01_NODE_5420_length_4274_cov_2.472096_2_plen_545_part_00
MAIDTVMFSTTEVLPCPSPAPANGIRGDCNSTVAPGMSCQPACDAGYVVSGPSSCSVTSVWTAATCIKIPTCGPGSVLSANKTMCFQHDCSFEDAGNCGWSVYTAGKYCPFVNQSGWSRQRNISESSMSSNGMSNNWDTPWHDRVAPYSGQYLLYLKPNVTKGMHKMHAAGNPPCNWYLATPAELNLSSHAFIRVNFYYHIMYGFGSGTSLSIDAYAPKTAVINTSTVINNSTVINTYVISKSEWISTQWSVKDNWNMQGGQQKPPWSPTGGAWQPWFAAAVNLPPGTARIRFRVPLAHANTELAIDAVSFSTTGTHECTAATPITNAGAPTSGCSQHTLLPGMRCQPICNAGYVASGPSTCRASGDPYFLRSAPSFAVSSNVSSASWSELDDKADATLTPATCIKPQQAACQLTAVTTTTSKAARNTSGSSACPISDGGHCITSRNYPYTYHGDDSCTITGPAGATVIGTLSGLANPLDYLRIVVASRTWSRIPSGSNLPESRFEIVLTPTTVVQWSASNTEVAIYSSLKLEHYVVLGEARDP